MANKRLQKVLAEAGVDSRRNCEELITEGVVRVNRKVVDTLPAFVDPDKDLITVSGRRIQAADKVYYLLNKPKGIICTNSDPQGRRRAIDLVPNNERVFCVGRLDADTSGLILITNDSELTNRLTHPRYGISKRYVATVKGPIEGRLVARLKKGVYLSEGKVQMSSVKILKRGKQESTLEITLKQGLNRQIRRMLASVDLDVKHLKRTKIGRLEVRGIGVGKCRALSTKEISYLKNLTGMTKETATGK
ncbi:pseudouridine synthase [Planctomycetota bacterium]